MRISWLLLISLFFVIPCCYAETSEVLLDDGSVIYADVVSLNNGKYTINSSTLGTVILDSTRVRSISRRGMGAAAGAVPSQPAGPAVGTPEYQAQLAGVHDAITNDPDTMKSIAAMAADPAFKDILSDPATLAAINSGDTTRLKDKPKFNAMMQDPRMRAIMEKVAGGGNNGK